MTHGVRYLSLFSAYALIFVGLVLGTRLLRMWGRTRKAPELLFGLQFLVAGTAVTALFVLRTRHPGLFTLHSLRVIYLVEIFGNTLGVIIKVVAVWRIFRPDRRWALALVILVGALAVVTYVSLFTSHPLVSPLQAPLQVSAYLWMAVEAIRYHGLLRRRMRLGLADPVVTNRVALWGGSATAVALMWTLLGLSVWVRALSTPQFMTLQVGILGLVSGALNWLAFYPPHGYVARIQRSRPAPTPAVA